MKTTIDIAKTDAGFVVTLRDDAGSSTHTVTVSDDDLERFDAADEPIAFIRECFEFLLEREPRTSILPSFDVSMIRRYFPEFDDVLRG